MKTIIQVFICTALLMIPYYGFSQSRYGDGPTDMDVKGVFIGGTYTKAQVEVKWGAPSKYWSGMSEFGLNEEYNYSTNLFRFGDNSIFHSFIIKTSDFPVYTALGGGIKVGDNISRIQAIGIGTPVLQSDGTYRVAAGDDLFIFRHSNGVITQISFTSLI